MRVDTIKTEVYKFSELSDEAKQTAIEQYREHGFTYDWWDYIFEDAKEAGKIIGIEITNIFFSGFSSQGDGACFEGDYTYKKGAVQAIKAFAPKDEELHRIAQALQDIQRKHFYSISASVKHSGHYSHRFCTNISVDFENHYNANDYYNEDAEKDIIETLRDYMLWIYKRLEAENDYMYSTEAIIETIEANENEFTENGNIY